MKELATKLAKIADQMFESRTAEWVEVEDPSQEAIEHALRLKNEYGVEEAFRQAKANLFYAQTPRSTPETEKRKQFWRDVIEVLKSWTFWEKKQKEKS